MRSLFPMEKVSIFCWVSRIEYMITPMTSVAALYQALCKHRGVRMESCPPQRCKTCVLYSLLIGSREGGGVAGKEGEGKIWSSQLSLDNPFFKYRVSKELRFLCLERGMGRTKCLSVPPGIAESRPCVGRELHPSPRGCLPFQEEVSRGPLSVAGLMCNSISIYAFHFFLQK